MIGSHVLHSLSGRDVVLVAGQSNCAGYLDVSTNWPAPCQCEQPGVLYAADVLVWYWHVLSDWQPMAPVPLATTQPTGWGATKNCTFPTSLAIRLLDKGWAPAIAHYAVTGTSITRWINVGDLYGLLRTFALAKLAELDKPRLRGLIWYQGEADVAVPATWQADMSTLASQLRSDLSAPTMPIVVVRIPTSYGATGGGPTQAVLNAFQAAQNAWQQSDAHSAIVEDPVATFNTFLADGVHIDGPSANRIGIYAADALAKLWGQG